MSAAFPIPIFILYIAARTDIPVGLNHQLPAGLSCFLTTNSLFTRRRCLFFFLHSLSTKFRRRARLSRKEVFQPHLPVRLPCYDLAPITCIALGRASPQRTSGAPGFHGLTGGVYKARERIHRAMADARLLANPASWSRVADSSPNWEGIC